MDLLTGNGQMKEAWLVKKNRPRVSVVPVSAIEKNIIHAIYNITCYIIYIIACICAICLIQIKHKKSKQRYCQTLTSNMSTDPYYASIPTFHSSCQNKPLPCTIVSIHLPSSWFEVSKSTIHLFHIFGIFGWVSRLDRSNANKPLSSSETCRESRENFHHWGEVVVPGWAAFLRVVFLRFLEEFGMASLGIGWFFALRSRDGTCKICQSMLSKHFLRNIC